MCSNLHSSVLPVIFNMQINSSIIYSLWPPLFLIICFSLSWKALHEAHRILGGSRPTPAAIWPSDSRENHEKFGKSCSRGCTTPKSPKDSDPGSLRASFPCWWTPGCGPKSTVGSFLSHVRAPSLAGRSKVLHQSSALGQCLSRETEANY